MNNFLLQQLITAKSQVQSVESQNNRLQHKLKDVNDEFRSRLIKYVQDIAVSLSPDSSNAYRISR